MLLSLTPVVPVLRGARRRVLLHRRGLAALCVATATLLGFRLVAAPPPRTTAVWTAVRDVPSGAVLRAADFHRTGYAVGSVPAGTATDLSAVVGRTLVTPLGRGEPISERKLLGPGRLHGYPGREAVAVRIPDTALVSLLRSGDRVDLLATDPRGVAPARRVARDAAVLTVVRGGSEDAIGSTEAGRLVVFAVAAEEVDGLAAAPGTGFLTAIWRR
ncbi:Flp pilus assembly protein CpaB [Marmoricola sp. RAF53]|uniref:Flp pilus assembly protein CpaB n=1 Tax=Marmoricola sp. RAF53 TaxID=3233059 RepID=UPI003F9A3E23